MQNALRNKLKSGEFTIGSWMQIPNASIGEILGRAGYDWIVIDLEHGSFSLETVVEIVRVLEMCSSLPFVRLAQIHPKDIKQALETGAKGLIFPMVESQQQLKEAIDYSLYPPVGKRGVGYSRANLFGKHFDKYYEEVSETFFVAQIEHINALNELDAILQVQRLDSIIVGPYDLSASMGVTGDFQHPDFLKAIKEIKSKACSFQVPMGIHIVQPEILELKERIKEGYQFIAYSLDAVFLYKAAEIPKVGSQ